MDDVASSFQLPASVVVERIRELIRGQRIEGVLERDGRFVCFSTSQLQSIVAWVKTKGEVSAEDVKQHIRTLMLPVG